VSSLRRLRFLGLAPSQKTPDEVPDGPIVRDNKQFLYDVIAMPNTPPLAQAHHVDFALHTLGWKAFQDLCAQVWSMTPTLARGALLRRQILVCRYCLDFPRSLASRSIGTWPLLI
jgi:hypothetical protein